jgi:hypothetical protein
MNNSDISAIFTDISAVKDVGLESFIDNYFWPVSDNDFHDFIEFINEEYAKLALKLENDLMFDIAMIETSFFSQLENIFHYNYVKEYSKDKSVDLMFGDGSKYFLYPDWNEHSNYYTKLRFPHGLLIRYLRKIVRNVVFNKNLPIKKYIYGFFSTPKIVSVGSQSELKNRYLMDQQEFCNYVDWPDLIKVNAKNKESIELHKKIVIDLLLPFINILKNKNSLFVRNFDFDKLELSWSNRFKDIANIYVNINKFDKPKTLLVTEAGKPISKLITTVYQRSGSDVYCFHHGNDFAIKAQNISHQRTVTHCKKFVVPSDSVANQYIKYYSKLPLEKRTHTKYISLGMRAYNDVNNESFNNSIKSVMIMGYPHNSTRYTDEKGLFSIFKIDLEYRLIRFLKDSGYRVIYKAHPDRLKEIGDLFVDFVDELISDPFEVSWKKSDAFIFTHTGTTTFGYSLSLGKRIVLINLEKCPLTIDEKHLENIFRVVPAKMDIDNRIQFDKKNLLDSLA